MQNDKAKLKNESEMLFEQYLDSNGYQGKWIYEPQIPGKSKRIDYLLELDDEKYFFEVKEMREKSNEPTEHAVSANLYSSMRKEIHEEREQFKEYKNYSCSLVIFNIGDNTFRLDPLFIFGAMLGNLGLQADYNPEKPGLSGESPRNVFLSGGKMLNHGKKQNTTISAVIVLETFLNNIDIEKAMVNEEKKLGRKFEVIEWIKTRLELQKAYSCLRVPRVVVVENPFARIPLPEDLFKGTFDERWRWIEEQDGKIERIFAGNKLKELEVLKGNTE